MPVFKNNSALQIQSASKPAIYSTEHSVNTFKGFEAENVHTGTRRRSFK